jgi:predicted metal-binding protein
MWYIYSTQDGKHYPIEIKYSLIPSIEILHDYARITNYCKTGCKNYNQSGGCPPRAPMFSQIAEQFPYGYIICAIFSSKWKPRKVKESTSKYIHFRFQDIVLSTFLTNLGYTIREGICSRIFFLNNGYCMGCGNKKCNFKSGANSCSNPQKRTFSLEATGVDVEATVAKLFDIKLQWYRNNNFNDVEYMAKSIGLFVDSEEKQLQINESLSDYLQVLPSTKIPLGSDKYNRLLRNLELIG